MKKFFLFIFLTISTLLVFSKNISQTDAKKAAENFIIIKYAQGVSQTEFMRTGECYVYGEKTSPDFYVFTLIPKGFVIISAVEERYPVIGYSFENNFEISNQPEHYKSFLQGYSDEIAYIRANKITPAEETKKIWKILLSGDPDKSSLGAKDDLDHLVTSKWDQVFPYFFLCPENSSGPGGHVYAGCVATAMSQVMYYWRYPLQGTGSHSYYYGQYGTISANFGATEYDWYGMRNDIDSKNPFPAAELQFHCGVAVDMMYSPNGSGAYSSDVPPAIENYFGYSTDAYFEWKDNFSNTEWINMLKENLNNGFPMYYTGFSNDGGHAFVCDGYDDNNFHFNFGWSGSSDGYYSLSSVNGFNSGQGAVFDTYPASGYPYYCNGDTYLTLKSGTIEDGSGPIASYQDMADCRWLISPQTAEDSISSIKISFSRFDVMEGDSLIIYNGTTTNDEILASLSGSEIPEPVTIEGNQVLIRFVSDESGVANGWLASFLSTSPSYCTGVTTLTDDSSTFTDGSGTFNYQNSSSCIWKITPENAENVTLSFNQFDTEPQMDFVRIYDLESQELLAEYSGHYTSNNLPAPVTSTSGTMAVMFYTNGNENFEGWTATYNTNAVGVETFSQNNLRINTYPNPVTGILNISLSSDKEEAYKIRIQNLSGQVIYTTNQDNTQSNTFSVDMSHYVQGVYILTIETGNKLIRRKITKL
jgi:hypothetical protein